MSTKPLKIVAPSSQYQVCRLFKNSNIFNQKCGYIIFGLTLILSHSCTTSILIEFRQKLFRIFKIQFINMLFDGGGEGCMLNELMV